MNHPFPFEAGSPKHKVRLHSNLHRPEAPVEAIYDLIILGPYATNVVVVVGPHPTRSGSPNLLLHFLLYILSLALSTSRAATTTTTTLTTRTLAPISGGTYDFRLLSYTNKHTEKQVFD